MINEEDLADGWAEDVHRMRKFLEVNLPSATKAADKLAAAAYVLNIRKAVIAELKDERDALKSTIKKLRQQLENTVASKQNANDKIR